MSTIKKLFLIFFILILACSKPETVVEKEILAKVGDRTISVLEFRSRAELTPRPRIFKDKNITLNNLIFEKLLSLEAGNDNELLNNPGFQARIKGIQEQKMREQLYYQEGLNKAVIDTSEMKRRYRLSIREYDLSFFSINKDKIGQEIADRIKNAPDSLTAIFNSLEKRTKIGKQTVKWKDPEHDAIHEALFSGPVKLDSIIGPLQLDEDEWIFMRVDNWRDYPIIGPEEAQLRVKEIQEKVGLIKGNAIWRNYMAGVMQGKQIDFDKDTFNKIVDLIYAKDLEQRKAEEPELPHDSTQNQPQELPIHDIREMDQMLSTPFFTIDNEVWTVGDFKAAVMSHPLVYRKQPLTKNALRRQFRYAVADLIRDHYLDKEAYKKGLDKHPDVQREKLIWSDYFNANYQREKILKNTKVAGNTDFQRGVNRAAYLDTYMDSLKQVYFDKILVDTAKLKAIELTSVDMFAFRKNVPFPVPVPVFPQLTVVKAMDYKTMNQEKQ